jgi:predicted amidohydrolase YtcJ
MFDEPKANRATLDKLSPNHPVHLACYWGHCSIFNSLFMRKMGIGDLEPDPPGGIYARDADGRIVGRSIEYANFSLHAKLQELAREAVQLQDAKQMLSEAVRFYISRLKGVLDGEPVLRTAALRQHYMYGLKESGHFDFSEAQIEVMLRESLRQKTATAGARGRRSHNRTISQGNDGDRRAGGLVVATGSIGAWRGSLARSRSAGQGPRCHRG